MAVSLTDDTSIIYSNASNIYRKRPAVSRPIVLSLLLLAVAPGVQLPLPAGQLRDVHGVAHDLFAPTGPASVLFFVTSDCPISNRYAPEIQRLCAAYRAKGLSCTLVYEDAAIDPAAVRAHAEAFGYRGIPAVIDTGHAIAAAANATVTPQAVAVGPGGRVQYRGRIDNRYERPGTLRRVVTVHDLRDALDDILAGRAVSRPATEAVGCFIPSGAARSAPR
jgi:thiol-disulfide isomerase/thioredoxin